MWISFLYFMEKKCLLELFIHFSKSVSYFPAVVLKFVVVACIFWILASIQIKSLQILPLILQVAFLLIVEETLLSSLSNFRILAKIIWPDMRDFFQDSLLMICWYLCQFCCWQNTVLTAVAFLPVLNSRSMKTSLLFFALKIVFFSLGLFWIP